MAFQPSGTRVGNGTIPVKRFLEKQHYPLMTNI
jgi:hypothetical protein